jgi:threonine/homoserine/homoserine lactone efflux protein
MAQHGQTSEAKAGQRVALTVAAVGVLWVLANLIGRQYGWSNRTHAIFDLAALAGFGFALWQTFQLWRSRRNDKGEN